MALLRGGTALRSGVSLRGAASPSPPTPPGTPSVATEGRTKVWSVPAIAAQATPSVAELNAGVALEALLTGDGLIGFEPDTGEVDNSYINSLFETRRPGRATFSGTSLRFKKQSGSDAIYNRFIRDYATIIVIRRGADSSSIWAIGDKVEVYPVMAGETRNLAPDPNGVQRYEVPCYVTSDPTIRGVVV